MPDATEKITLVGAGLAGSLLAIFLARGGFQVDIYERRPDMRQVDMSAGRSINLAMSTRGIYALQQVGLYEAVQRLVIPMRGRMIHTLDGALHFQPYGQDASEVLQAISRADLNKILLQAAEAYTGVRIFFHEHCQSIQVKTGTLLLHHATTGAERSVPTERVIGTDGAASAIRTALLSGGRGNFSQEYIGQRIRCQLQSFGDPWNVINDNIGPHNHGDVVKTPGSLGQLLRRHRPIACPKVNGFLRDLFYPASRADGLIIKMDAGIDIRVNIKPF